MIRTDAENYFVLMGETGKEVLEAMNAQKDSAYPGTLLTQLTKVEGRLCYLIR